MAVLKDLYRRGILVKRSPCSNASLYPFKITYTERVGTPYAKLMDDWVSLSVIKPYNNDFTLQEL